VTKKNRQERTKTNRGRVTEPSGTDVRLTPEGLALLEYLDTLEPDERDLTRWDALDHQDARDARLT
jgi:hypothetical protein